MFLRTFTRFAATAAAVALALPAGASAKTVAPNTGASGSKCKGQQLTAPAPANQAELDTTSLGATAAPYSIGAPTRAPEKDEPVKRVMVLLHGGGWYTVGQGALNLTQPAADLWRAAGWETVNMDYLPCGKAIRSALKTYDRVRAHFGADVPICVSGDSSGAQLALMIATRRRDVACVIANGAPTDLRRLAKQGSHAALAGLAPATLLQGAAAALGKAIAAFGLKNLVASSPLTSAGKIRSRVLLASAADDMMIPVAQVASMAKAIRKAVPGAYVDTDILGPGAVSFVHGTASPAAVADYYKHVEALVKPFGDAPGQPKTVVQQVIDPISQLLATLFGRG